MKEMINLQGRELTPLHLSEIQRLITDHSDWSRRRLSQELCRAWDWRNAKGDIKDMACRTLLVKLDERGFIQLPPRRQKPSNRMAQRIVAPVPHQTTPIEGPLKALQPLRVLNIQSHAEYEPLCSCLLSFYHYLGYRSAVGENMKYLILDRHERPLGCMLFGSSAWTVGDRDRFLGWNAATRKQHLHLTTSNTRFLILPWVRVPHLASHILGLISRRISYDWQSRYGHPVYLLETFVDQTRFQGTCYQAANWFHVGQTQGRSRNDRYQQLQVPVKSVYLYPLTKDYRTRLLSHGD